MHRHSGPGRFHYNTVQGSDYAVGPTGPTFTLTQNYAGTDALFFTASGSVNIASTQPPGYQTNAAGVTDQASNSLFGGTFTPGYGANLAGGPFATSFGSLLVSTDNFTTNGFQLFLTDASNGFGNTASGQSVVTRTGTIADVFGGGLTAGTVLTFRISDNPGNDNTGAFNLSGFLAAPDPVVGVPEMSAHAALTPVCLMLCLFGLIGSRRRIAI